MQFVHLRDISAYPAQLASAVGRQGFFALVKFSVENDAAPLLPDSRLLGALDSPLIGMPVRHNILEHAHRLLLYLQKKAVDDHRVRNSLRTYLEVTDSRTQYLSLVII